MRIRFLVVGFLLAPAVMASAQVKPARACDGHCQHSHSSAGSALSNAHSDPWSARMNGNEYRARAQSGYGSSLQNQTTQNRAPGIRPYDQVRSAPYAERRHSNYGNSPHERGHSYWPGDRHGGLDENQYRDRGANPGMPSQRFATPSNSFQSPRDRDQIEQPSLPLAYPKASPQVDRQPRRPQPANRSSYWNI